LPAFLDVTLGSQSVPGVEDDGFYNNEQSGGKPFRWTNGRARLVIPLDRKEPPRALWVRVHRPKNTWLQITVNDRELAKEKPTDRDMAKWERTLDLGGIDLGDRAVVEIVSNTVSPQNVDPKQNHDTRALGVQVGGLALLRLRPGDRTPSVVHVTPGEASVPGVEESGLYAEERDGEGLFRWTDGKARLVIPVNKKEPPQELIVLLDRPPDRSLKITVNGRELFNEPARGPGPRRWEQTFALNGIDLGEALTIEIVSNTSVTRETPREIGVQVRAIQLRRGGGEQAPPREVPPGR
jgi:hypothetical protein